MKQGDHCTHLHLASEAKQWMNAAHVQGSARWRKCTASADMISTALVRLQAQDLQAEGSLY